MRPFRFYIASLGCPKNTVDSQAMATLLSRAGYEVTLQPEDADLVIVNTCGFIASARQESLDTLRDLARGLRGHQRLVAAGCWAQRDPDALIAAIPRLDAVLGTRSWPEILSLAGQLLPSHHGPVLSRVAEIPVMLPEQVHTAGYVVSGASAFLKIGDGCNRQCAFCAIPAIKGPFRSRSIEAIVEDVLQLQSMGVLEINLIAQDATYYGHDLGLKDGLVQLLERLVNVAPDVPWLRILYAFPGYVTPRLITAMAQFPQILPYLDIPLQHAHPDVLRRMHRPSDVDWVRHTVERLRTTLPDVALRTTFIVGYPGETEAEFQTLLDFVNEMRFDRVGVFTYSHEAGTAAADLMDDVSSEEKEERRERLMLTQQDISLDLNARWVGRRLPVLLEGVGDGLTVGRSYRDAPEIDGLVLIQEEIPPHRIATVEITEAMEYDLVGRVVESV
ncbi:MAG: 30S ribosomal protein S12 methylthiotransferase RimO [Anaerolineae bacterium]|nr:30S ribosomal protein S12 methylthiotransferase RimO [Anaerolineae bacterium]